MAGLGLAPAVAGAAEAPGRVGVETVHGIEAGYGSQEACEADRLVFRHYGLATNGCFFDPAPDRQWYFYWVNP